MERVIDGSRFAVSHLYEEAQRYWVGGVCATARANSAIGHPLYVARGDGARIVDVEGREYIDMCMSHGASGSVTK